DTRTSYHVGRPWMFDGKMLRELMGTPMRRIDVANRRLALAEPEPLTLADLMTKSLVASSGRGMRARRPAPCPGGIVACPRRRAAQSPQCRQTSSSLAMMLPVLSVSET